MSTAQRAQPRRPRCVSMPPPRGPLSEQLAALLTAAPGEHDGPQLRAPASADPLRDEDLQLSLYLLYELHYADVEDVDPRWEWHPSLSLLRAELECSFEQALHELVGDVETAELTSVGETLQALVAADKGPALSRYAEQEATREQMLEHVVHRSAYQLKEADPHSFAIPRLSGPPKAALVEIQFDEYGEGHAARMHAELFAQTMSTLGLDPTYGAYLDRLPAITLASVNLMTMFGLHRRWRGALAGHLAIFEMTSSIPNRRYGNALRRLGCGPETTAFYDEHVTADAVHESIAAWDLADALARTDPDTAPGIVFGARALLAVEALWAEHLLDAWARGESSLLSASSPL